MESISPVALSQLKAQGPIEILDVRTPAEFASVHAAGARNEPLHDLDPKGVMSARQGAARTPLYVICKGGSRSTQACQKFLDAGFGNVVNVEGGTEAWEAAGLPVQKSGRKAIAIDRQMRILAGCVIVTGIVLSFAVHPAFQLLSAFIGGGLVFAGVTDCCPMMNVIAKMPWNQAPKGSKVDAGNCQSCSV